MALNLKSVTGARVLMAAVLLLLPPLYFCTAIGGPVSLMPGDGWSQIMGIRILTGRMIAQGLLPLWNPYIFGGMPLLASIQPGALYPPNWLFALLTPRAAMNVLVITTYHLALIGAYLFARRLELDRASALVTGLIFTFGGYLLAHLGHTNRIAAAAWLPWILLAIEHLYRRATWRWVTIGALCIMLQNLAGEFQMTFYTLLVCGPYAIFSLTLRPPCERRGRVFVYLALMALSGALLSAIQVIPARELLQLGERAGISYDYFSLYSFPPYQLFALIFPYFFGGAGTSPYYVTFWGNWNPPETTCYVGLAGLLLAFVAIFGKGEKPERRMIWFWTAMALAAMTLAFGSYLPFGLNRLLHRVPVFNLFRAAGRHYFEFSFAIAVLAGLGLNHLTHAAQRRRFKWAVVVLAMLVAATAVAYRFFLDRFPVFYPRYTTAHLLTNPEALIPLLVFALCVAAFLVHVRWRNRATSALMAAVVLIDLASWGWFFEWQVYRFDVAAALSDPPAVTFIKAREADLNSFRIVSQAADPYDKQYRELDYPNVSIARGLQSVNGYDPVRLDRFAAIAGGMSLGGAISDPEAFGPAAQGFNLLNVRYLLRERAAPAAPWSTAAAPELRFSDNPASPRLEPGAHIEWQADGAMASELALVSAMGNSTDIADQAPVVRIRLHTIDGRVIEREMLAGRDTAEWAHDRRDVRDLMKHRRAVVAESFPAADFEGHRYLARFTFDRAEIDYIELDYVAASASVQITRASLYDAQTRTSTPLSSLRLTPERWRKLQNFGPVDLYENVKALPRAWFVRRVEALPDAEVLAAIKAGKFRDGRPFDPAETALFGTEDFGGRPVRLPETGDPTGAAVSVTSYQPQRITLRTRNAQPGFLVLSEIWYRGWEAWIDGQRVPVERVNYTLRGLAVPPGEHQLEFVFRAHSFRNGAMWSAVGALLLLLGAALSLPGVLSRRSRRKAVSRHS